MLKLAGNQTALFLTSSFIKIAGHPLLKGGKNGQNAGRRQYSDSDSQVAITMTVIEP